MLFAGGCGRSKAYVTHGPTVGEGGKELLGVGEGRGERGWLENSASSEEGRGEAGRRWRYEGVEDVLQWRLSSNTVFPRQRKRLKYENL